ncbi:MAG: heat-inducible transcriptional repressor HrcA [Candidatus Nanopelagicales bacterium]|nr:heat-inducible transcriptional repressor HrcA [Candidatus Nanopelagicales bacterium]
MPAAVDAECHEWATGAGSQADCRQRDAAEEVTMADERRFEVLRAIVEDFVATREPVGSKALVERHNLGVSSATVRNDMAALEDEGYIVQPHTSAGRVPTDMGYRTFVDRLATIRPMSASERRGIRTFMDGAVDLDDVVERTVRLLVQFTKQVAMVQYPSLRRSRVRHVEFVALDPHRLLVVLIADTGRVEQRIVESPTSLTEAVLGELRARINVAVADRPFADVSELVSDLPESFHEEERAVVSRVLDTLQEATVEESEERVVIGGAANLARYGREFPLTLAPVLDALEEHVVLLRLLGDATAAEEVDVRIGHENDIAGMDAASVVTVGYGPNRKAVAHLGVVGPTRMDYPGTMGTVRAVAKYLGRILADQR